MQFPRTPLTPVISNAPRWHATAELYRLGHSGFEQPGYVVGVDAALCENPPLNQDDRDSKVIESKQLSISIDIELCDLDAEVAELGGRVVTEMTPFAPDELDQHSSKATVPGPIAYGVISALGPG